MSTAGLGPMDRRDFLETLGRLSLGATAAASLSTGAARGSQRSTEKVWQPVSERKVRVGIVGYGVCQFGAAFGFQDHPNVEIVAVSDLIAERRAGLMQACRCEKSYESLEVLVKDPKIEAVFVATDAPNHAKHCMEVLHHGKHVMTAVPAVWAAPAGGRRPSAAASTWTSWSPRRACCRGEARRRPSRPAPPR